MYWNMDIKVPGNGLQEAFLHTSIIYGRIEQIYWYDHLERALTWVVKRKKARKWQKCSGSGHLVENPQVKLVWLVQMEADLLSTALFLKLPVSFLFILFALNTV